MELAGLSNKTNGVRPELIVHNESNDRAATDALVCCHAFAPTLFDNVDHIYSQIGAEIMIRARAEFLSKSRVQLLQYSNLQIPAVTARISRQRLRSSLSLVAPRSWSESAKVAEINVEI